ncbi:hypothetical protein E4T38_05212 [Aureobasidium subglaciale]|nr:hypothetical protein E4T38_05212 [Aureobasidium subglaciale]KAI5220368.1 hypothetical protein E4T40_05976 [Aureobasidium subglaciale]KAI5222927.1 hypothetical protein E4T41_06402 [Aureobasidium subglaciale]KAI5260166.1 hypothetical protein E4T46_06284 [Aureobasidium subglaciale]
MYEIDLSYISRAEILPPFFTFYMELPPGTRLYTWDVDHLSIGLDFDLESAPERLSKLHSAVYGGTKTESEIPNVYPAIWQGDHDQKYEVLEGFLSNSSTFLSFLWRSFTAEMHLHGQRSSGQAGYVRLGELTPLYDSSDQWIRVLIWNSCHIL